MKSKDSLFLSKRTAMKAYGEAELELHKPLTLALIGDARRASLSSLSIPRSTVLRTR